MDITETTAPRSDQQNFDDYVSGPKTVTISEVRAGTTEQPVEIHLVEFPGRPFKPSKTVRRILIAAWGPEASNYIGRRMTLFGDPTIKFGGAVVGGIRVSHLSHIDKPLTINLTETRGKRKPHRIDPLPDVPAVVTDAEVPEFEQRIADANTCDELNAIAADLKARNLGSHAGQLKAAWSARTAAIKAATVEAEQ
jgi:hypothetical protein